MKTFIITNQKGGIGKSTTAEVLSSAFSRKGYRVLLIDTDPQCNSTRNVGVQPSDNGVWSVLTTNAGVLEGIEHGKYFDVLSSSPMLKNVDSMLLNTLGKESRLREAFVKDDLASHYDFVFIDTPTITGTANLNAMLASDYVIIPTGEPNENGCQEGIGQIFSIIRNVRKYYYPELKIMGILRTDWNERGVNARYLDDKLEQMAEMMGTRVFDTHIRRCVDVSNRLSTDTKDLFDYNKNCTSAQDYITLADEIEKYIETEEK